MACGGDLAVSRLAVRRRNLGAATARRPDVWHRERLYDHHSGDARRRQGRGTGADAEHALQEGGPVGLPETGYFAKMSDMNRRFLMAAYVVAALMALGGALSVMNTQFAAVHQRAKDIGVLRVLGYTRPQLLMSFLLESLAIALLGGSAGCALGFLANGLSAAGTLAGDQGVKDVVLELVVDGKTIRVALLF